MNPSNRSRLIAVIHVAKRDLHLDEAVYRDALSAATGKDSLKAMTEAEMHQVIDHFTAFGFQVQGRAKQVIKPDPLTGKIRALWFSLKDAGKLRNSSEEALRAYVVRMTGVETLNWCSVPQKIMLIESMKKWLARPGVTS